MPVPLQAHGPAQRPAHAPHHRRAPAAERAAASAGPLERACGQAVPTVALLPRVPLRDRRWQLLLPLVRISRLPTRQDHPGCSHGAALSLGSHFHLLTTNSSPVSHMIIGQAEALTLRLVSLLTFEPHGQPCKSQPLCCAALPVASSSTSRISPRPRRRRSRRGLRSSWAPCSKPASQTTGAARPTKSGGAPSSQTCALAHPCVSPSRSSRSARLRFRGSR